MRPGQFDTRLGGKPRVTTFNTEAYRQGQRDREQGWPDLWELWGLSGQALDEYRRGFANPRPFNKGGSGHE